MKVAQLILVGIIVLFVVSCASKPENAIVGKWQTESGGKTMEFLKDGTVIIVFHGFGGGSSAANYKFIDEKRLKIDSEVVEVSISKNELITTLPRGEQIKYRRVK